MDIKLTPVTPGDFPVLISWAVSEEFLVQWTGRTFTYPLNDVQLNDYIVYCKGKDPSRFFLKAIDESNGKHIGNITIDCVNSKKNEAALTCIIIGDNDYKGKGAGEFIVKEAVRFAVHEFRKKKLFLNVFDFNIPAIKCYKKCGFAEVRREKITINGHDYMNIRMELI